MRFSLAIIILAVVETIVGALIGEKTTFLFHDVYHLSASRLAELGIVIGIPSYLQPFVGGWTDLHPLFGFHRRSYMVIGTLGISSAYAGLAIVHGSRLWSVVCMILMGASMLIMVNVTLNAAMVRLGNRTGNFGRFQSLLVFVPYVLSLVYASHFGGYVTQYWSYTRAYGTAALLVLLLLPSAFLIEEKRIAPGTLSEYPAVPTARDVARAANRTKLLVAAKSPGMWVLAVYVFYLIITPGPNSTYYYADGLHLSKQVIGDVGRWVAVGAILGMLIFGVCSRRMPIIALALGAWLMDCVGYPFQLAMRSEFTVNVYSLWLAIVGIMYTLCLNSLAARACPPGIEGAIYGVVMAAIALGTRLNAWLGNWIYDFYGPANHHTVTYGYNASLIFGLLFTLPAGLMIPFLPADLRSRKRLADVQETSADD